MFKSNYFAHTAAILTVFIWGTTFISTKVLLAYFTPIEILFMRFGIGFLCLWMMQPKRLTLKDNTHKRYFIGAGLCGVTLYFLFENIALTYSLASNIGVIVSTAPLFTAILAAIFLKDTKIHRNFILGFMLALFGIFLISFRSSSHIEVNPIGDLLAILAAIVWAFYSILMKRIGEFGYPTIQATKKIFMYGILFMIPCLFFMDFHPDITNFTNPIVLLNTLYLGIGASALCFVSWNYAIKTLGALKASAYIYLVPIITVTFSAIILNEPITWVIVLGTLCTLLGLYLSERKAKATKGIELAVEERN